MKASIGFAAFSVAFAALSAHADPQTQEQKATAAISEEDEAFLGRQTGPEGQESKDGGKSAKDGDDGKKERKLDHFFQGFASVLGGTGWHFVAPYDKDDPKMTCSGLKQGTNPAKPPSGDPYCAGRSSFHLDFQGGFAPLPGFEVFAIFRLGLERPDTYSPLPRQLGAGVKFYTPKDGLFKLGFGLAPLFDFSDRKSDIGYDFVIFIPIQIQFDFIPWLGAFLQFGPNISFITEFRFDTTIGLGVQGRFP